MLQKFKKVSISLAALAALLLPVAALLPASVSAKPNISHKLCEGANLEVGSGGTCDAQATGTQVNNLIESVINIFSIIVGVVAVIMMIYGGFRYITSGGDSGNIQTAKNTILYAIIGLIIVALSQFLVKFVLGQASGFAT